MKPSAADRKVEVYTRENSAPYSGAVGYLSPNINLSTGTITLRASIENPRGELKDGLYVTVRIKSAYKENALLVPSLSVGTDQLGKYLYVVGADNKVNYRHIATSGRRYTHYRRERVTTGRALCKQSLAESQGRYDCEPEARTVTIKSRNYVL